MKVKLLHPLLRLIDHLMSPFMRLISLAPFERPQESHAWHAQKLTSPDIGTILLERCVTVKGDDPSGIRNGSGPLFHIPAIGGWKKYVVLKIQTVVPVWHIGWIVRETESNRIVRAELHRLPLYESRLRLLVGTPERTTTFCAFDARGEQLPLVLVGKGSVGDGSGYGKVRLF